MIRTPNTIRPVALVMSATIAPPPRAPELARSNPSLRLSDYCDALRFYLSLPDDVLHKVLFIDNSNYDLSALEAIANMKCHIGNRLSSSHFREMITRQNSGRDMENLS